MVRRRQRRHLVPIPRVLKKEQFHLFRNLGHVARFISSAEPWMGRQASRDHATYLDGRQKRPPLVHQLGEHAVRATLFHLSESSEYGEFVVGHAHVDLQRGRWFVRRNMSIIREPELASSACT